VPGGKLVAVVVVGAPFGLLRRNLERSGTGTGTLWFAQLEEVTKDGY